MSKHTGIKTWALADRPREKFLEQGRRALSDVELLAILIGSGTANESAVDVCRQIMSDLDNNLHNLAKLDVGTLCRYRGVGEAKAVRIMAALELGRRRDKHTLPERPILDSSVKVYDYLRHLFLDLQHEEAWVLYLNAGKRLIRMEQIGKGGTDYTPVEVRKVLRIALEHNASGIILSHNHPSGTLLPSKADMYLTDKLIAAGHIYDVEILDHLIFTDEGYISFLDEGWMDR